MKTIISLTTGLALMTVLAACVVTSVYPFYTDKDVVFDPALIGAWAEAGSTNAPDEHWRFEQAGGLAYKLTIQDKEKRTEFDTHLFKLKGRLFLDLYPRERPEDSLPLHYLLKVTRIERMLEVNMLDYDWLKKLVERNPQAIRHLVVPRNLGENGEGNLVLTADTVELQKFILKHAKTEGAFGKGSVMHRWEH
jgi:hypothetical protein